MYRFSRSIYRELVPRMIVDERADPAAQQALLCACEATIRRLAYDRRYFAKPARTLFREVRGHFPISSQLHVYKVIEQNLTLAADFMARMPAEVGLDGLPRQCHASTRKGKPCQREPLPGRDYCPSHKHLEEPAEELAPLAA